MYKFTLWLFLAILNFCANAQVYVSTNGSGNGSGSSWANSSTLENAILNSSMEDELWLKNGTYLISETLNLTNYGLKLYGGFEGNETSLNQRDWENNLTILDGQNNVQIMEFKSREGIIDGIHFVKGYITGSIEENNTGGGAIRVRGFNQIIRNCTFKNNKSNSQRGGGAIFIWHGDGLLIENCQFIENQQTFTEDANGGGAIHNWDDNVTIKNSKFIENNAKTIGGAIFTWGNNLKIEDCDFKENQSDYSGGAIFSWDDSLIVKNTEFIENIAHLGYGGAIHNQYDSKLSIFNSTFISNVAEDVGGAISNFHEANISNTLFYGNNTNTYGGAINSVLRLNITNSTFVSNTNTAIVHQKEIDTNDFVNIYNSIFYENDASTNRFADVDVENKINTYEYGNYRYNIFQENENGFSNLVGVDPMFKDFENQDFSLSLTSQAGNYGDNNLFNQVSIIPIEDALDLNMNPRLYGTKIDLGAYEVQEAMSIQNHDLEDWKIFPNPVKNEFQIQGDLSNFEILEIFDLNGKLLKNHRINFNSSNILSVKDFSPGIYIIKLSNSKNSISFKLIKK